MPGNVAYNPANDPDAFQYGNRILSVENLSVSYGAIQAIRDVSFHVEQGEIVTLIGANGAGKTTTLRAISGLVRPARGRIIYKGANITAWPAHRIVAHRLCHAPEGRGIFLNLTVEDNLDLGAWSVKDRSVFAHDLERAYELFPRLKERRSQNAGTLSGGELQMLSIARALMGRPDLLLLDEPSLGLAPQVIETIFGIVTRINSAGKTVFLVEQNALQALKIANRGIVMETGRIVAEGPAKELLASDDIRKAYLGE